MFSSSSVRKAKTETSQKQYPFCLECVFWQQENWSGDSGDGRCPLKGEDTNGFDGCEKGVDSVNN